MTEDELDLDLLKKTITFLEKRADYTDIRVNESYNTAIIMKDSKIQEIRSGSDLGGCIRVLKGGAWGFAFTNQISKIGEAAESALKLANSLQSDVELSDARPEVDTVKCRAKLKPSDVSMDEKKEIMSDADSAAKIPKVVSTTVNYVDTEGTTTFLNSEGSFLTIEESRVAMFLNAVASDEGIIQFGHKSIGGAKGFEAVKNEDIEKFGRTAASKAVRLLKANSPPSGSFPVVLDSELTGVFIHEALGHATEADLILQNDSILKGKMGTQIGSKLVTIVDDASMDAFGYYPYDAEGVKTRENVLVKDGTLVSLMSSRETASKLGITPSGSFPV
ncbi:MAG: TldD/PmbA family protein, partial [Methanobacterium paludis]|nr:TldD/PmbA family protein [Methanobacterium paludis]